MLLTEVISSVRRQISSMLNCNPRTKRNLLNNFQKFNAMQIKLKRLTLDNFKGIKRFVVDIKDNDTKIFGANGTGKTTLFDSFLWLLFDKDSTGRKDFEIKTLTSEGKTLKDVEHVVEGVFEIDGTDVVLKKIHREKWVRKRGFTNEEFTGNETTYFWNDVPVKKDEYNSKIADVYS